VYRNGLGPTRSRHGATQDWSLGALVNVGFLKGLRVLAKNEDGSYVLESAKGARYSFEPHQGIFAL
jgi:hypothetical protein